jgi:hypothetical protein
MPRTLDSTLRYSGVSDVVAYTGTQGQSAAVPANIHDVRVVCTSNAWINIGTDPTATAGDNSLYMPAGVVEYFHITPGQKIAAVQDSGAGNLVVGFMTR